MKYSFVIFSVFFVFILGCGQDTAQKPATDKKKTMVVEKKAITGVAHFQDNEIKIDGSSKDWGNNGVVLNEVGQPHDGGMGGFDVQSLQIGYDNQNLYFLLSMDKGVMDYYKAKEGGGIIGSIYLDTDGDTTSGCLNNEDIFGFPAINGYDVRIWIPVGVAYMESGNKATASYKVNPLSEDRGKFESFKKLLESGSLENPDMIQFKEKNLEFSIPLKTLNIKRGTTVRGVISEYANSFRPGSANKFSVLIK